MSDTPQETEASIETTFAQMNTNQLTFGGDVEEFFDAYNSTDTALDGLQPLLFAAANAAKDSDVLFVSDSSPVDDSFEWTAIYHLINDYAFHREGVEQISGNLVVPTDVIQSFFADEFGSTGIPDIPDDLSQIISFDQAAGMYTLVSADEGGYSFVLNDIILTKGNASEQSAAIRLDILNSSGETVKTVAVEIAHSDISAYLYAVISVYTVG